MQNAEKNIFVNVAVYSLLPLTIHGIYLFAFKKIGIMIFCVPSFTGYILIIMWFLNMLSLPVTIILLFAKNMSLLFVIPFGAITYLITLLLIKEELTTKALDRLTIHK